MTDYILRVLAKASLYLAFSSLVILAVLLWSPLIHWQGALSVILTFPLFMLNMIWWVFVMALFGARYPDTAEAIHTALMLGFLLTPILWVGNRFGTDSIGGILVRLNPAYHLIEIVRAPILGHTVAVSTYMYLAMLTLVGWLLAMTLYRRYARFAPLWI